MPYTFFSNAEAAAILADAEHFDDDDVVQESVTLTLKQAIRVVGLGERPSHIQKSFATVQHRQEYMDCVEHIAAKKRRREQAPPSARLTSGALFDLFDWCGHEYDEDSLTLEEHGKAAYVQLAVKKRWVPSYIEAMKLCFVENCNFDRIFDTSVYPSNRRCRAVIEVFHAQTYNNGHSPAKRLREESPVVSQDNVNEDVAEEEVEEQEQGDSKGKAPATPAIPKSRRAGPSKKRAIA